MQANVNCYRKRDRQEEEFSQLSHYVEAPFHTIAFLFLVNRLTNTLLNPYSSVPQNATTQKAQKEKITWIPESICRTSLIIVSILKIVRLNNLLFHLFRIVSQDTHPDTAGQCLMNSCL